MSQLAQQILIIEDEPSIAELIAVNLTHTGYVVRRAMQSDEALSMLADQVPDLIVLDWMLPELAKVLRPDSEEGAAAMLEHLDTPNRVVLELTPEYQLTFDSKKMWTHRPAAAPPGRL